MDETEQIVIDTESESFEIDSVDDTETEYSETETPFSFPDYEEVPAATESVVEESNDGISTGSDVSFNVSVVFVVSMIFGLFVFQSLSRRWFV
jgi:hypothetical protein